MAILNNSNAISAAGGYDVNNSLRLRASASAYLTRTLGSASSRTTWTYSFWFKRGLMGGTYYILSNGNGNANNTEESLYFEATDKITFINVTQNVAVNWDITTAQVFRDPSAWYHLVIAVDTTQATASNRIKFYVNGNQITSFSSANYPSQNANMTQGASGLTNEIGRRAQVSNNYNDCYYADFHFVTGQQLTPSSFGETDTTTGVWKPKAYSGTYGTNGYYLKFSDIATTSGSNAGLGKDFSGNGNYFNTNNISVTSGTTYDAMTDSPTNTSATVANYATFSGTNLGTYANATITEGGLRVSVSAGGTPDGGKAYAPFGMSDGSGKWYFEMTCVDPGAGNQRLCFGIVNITTNPNAVAITNGYYASASGAHGNYNIGTFTTNDVLQVAYDSGTNKLWFGKNNTWYNSGNPAAGTTPLVTVTSGITYAPFSTYASSGQGPGIGAWNFGQRPFAYTPPTGFNRLNTYNLPDSTIKKGNSYFDATAYTGTNGSPTTQVISSNFRPDFLWFKKRSASYDHALIDTSRGITKQLYSNNLNSEGTDGDVLTAIGASSFTVGNSNYSNYGTLVAWTWKANAGSTSSNTSGSITSTVQANTTSGFSIVTYTGTGSSATVGHGLGVAPKMVIIKYRSGPLSNWLWFAYHIGLSNYNYALRLQATDAQTLFSSGFQAYPTSSVLSMGSEGAINYNGNAYVAYCWAEIAGFSRFGSYTGNGSSDGPFVFTGFSPKYLMIKSSSIAGEWAIYDVPRDLYNPMGLGGGRLRANTADAETGADSAQYIDFLSNGFKIRNTSGFDNQSGATYIYAAFASNPFKNSNAF